MKKKKIGAAIIGAALATAAGVGIKKAVDYGVNNTLFAKRKTKERVLTEYKDRYNIDFSIYESLEEIEVTLESFDGLTLKGYYYEKYKDSKKVVIINHGYTSNHFASFQFTDVFFEEGYNVLLVDMRSHGESEGDYVSYGLNEAYDMEKWIDWVYERVGKDAYIGVHGQSMGAATAMICGGRNEERIKFVIEDCGFTRAKDVIKVQFKKKKILFRPLYDLMRYRIIRRYNYDLNKVNPIDVIAKSKVPTMFIHGSSDKKVPVSMAYELFNEKKGEKDSLYIVEGAGHVMANCTDREMYKEKIKEFLNKL